MQIYFIRHGIAQEPADSQGDALRSLTDKGRAKSQYLSKRCLEIGVRFDVILTSPLVRARQTAAILLASGLSSQLEESPWLAPEGSLEDWLDWLARSEYNKENCCLALVGHQPDLGIWAQRLVWGQSQEKLILKKNGVIAIDLPSAVNPWGQGLLFLLTSPKWL
jgi:phosphohistidine phosphatase